MLHGVFNSHQEIKFISFPFSVTGTEVAVLKKKMKKRPGLPANVSVSQLMVQRERPLAEFKVRLCVLLSIHSRDKS